MKEDGRDEPRWRVEESEQLECLGYSMVEEWADGWVKQFSMSDSVFT